MKVLAAEEFISRFCDIEEFERRYEDNRRDLGAAYIDYVFTVSNAVHAISLPLAAFVGSMCDVGSPKAVIDLGSGFSSYVLRRYAAKQPAHVHVTTADDDPSWLEKTRAFLELAGLSEGELALWDATGSKPGSFDVVLYDLGLWEARVRELERAVALARTGGVVILDDLHVSPYRDVVERVLETSGQTPYDLTKYTRDEFGRYSWAIVA